VREIFLSMGNDSKPLRPNFRLNNFEYASEQEEVLSVRITVWWQTKMLAKGELQSPKIKSKRLTNEKSSVKKSLILLSYDRSKE